jgi:DNA-binding transcriptional MerR regulator
MDKSPEAFRTISEVAEVLDVPPHVLRFWETRFAQVKPVKRGGGRRYYRPEDVRLLRGIRGLLYDDGMTIKGVQKILRERGIRHVIGLGTVPEPEAALVAAPEPAPAPRTRRAADVNGAPAAGASPQPDLFGPASGGAATATVAPPREQAAAAAAKPHDRRALRKLLSELQALRAVMIDDGQR